LAHYLYLWELTAVPQAVETAWISASVRRTFIELLVPAGSSSRFSACGPAGSTCTSSPTHSRRGRAGGRVCASGIIADGLWRNHKKHSVEPFGEPAVDRREGIAGLGAPALVAAKPGEARSGAQFPELGLLLSGKGQSPMIQFLGGLGTALPQEQLAQREFIPAVVGRETLRRI
jgi:hypothetical protein